ncbi:MAG TPA: AAA family ATPase, partial [Pyrinomonadaceae bacterium]|nr:AAA family ATPase [Pyrinomonadaceae bacterium]
DGGTIDEIIGMLERPESWHPKDEKKNEESSESIEFQSCFLVKTANEWLNDAKTRPIPKMLCGELWFEDELCILFADTNLGKSIFAVQIGETVASGLRIIPFDNTATKQKVLYFDFELSEKQFETRYAEKDTQSEYFTNHYPFSENFFRCEINPDAEQPKHFRTFEEYISFSLEYLLAESDAKILIVDNLTYLRNETEKAKDALPLMKELKRLKKKYGLSILALAHTPKRDLSKPITRNDLQGSKMLINFCDSSFAIGESTKDQNLRYVKQIKARNTSIIYDSENVCVFQIEKPSNFLRFDFIEYGKESEHLKQVSEKDRETLIATAKELSSSGKTQREIGKMLGISLGTVNKYLKK